ncbi:MULTISPECIES: hypothetical protein [Streptomyces]|uniref:Uncharacterized protein n=3 Tax=Streptomyces rimosus TaxID=1927 RepID=A0A8A1V707_STRR1|nr:MULTISPECIES: hypothetical protein [Streptomyces]MYT42039.1 hypothetical protein [Streptomyces sp. SID5471]QGY70863.1 hypothetical protein V519_037720 [Streptomyces rimosus R6-500]QST86665.1 hypothetical protein SRIM_041360 [Streptomyces rimosus subsp. rimosus ATCC 10970]QXV92093.1 hypothetical protein M4018_082910 [Streptomyces rimosus]QXV92362.1 hypothetical protein R6500_082910 [Streptomyces rimosus]
MSHQPNTEVPVRSAEQRQTEQADLFLRLAREADARLTARRDQDSIR